MMLSVVIASACGENLSYFLPSFVLKRELELKMYTGFQVDVPLEVVHLTEEYWRNVVSAFTTTKFYSITLLDNLMMYYIKPI